MKYGYIGAPTTFFSVRPRPGCWVCFWWNMMNRCADTRPRIRPGISSTWMMYSRGTMSFPGNCPPNRKNEMYVPTIGMPRITPSRIRSPVPDSRSSGSE